MTTMTYGQLVKAYVAVREERHRLRAEVKQLSAEIDRLRADLDRRRETSMPEPELMTYGELAEAYRRALAEIDKLRARVREWEAVNADLAKRCDSGDIPTRLGERYSQAVLREIDRLRTERDRLLEELPEDNTIAAAVRRLRALGSTPDTEEQS